MTFHRFRIKEVHKKCQRKRFPFEYTNHTINTIFTLCSKTWPIYQCRFFTHIHTGDAVLADDDDVSYDLAAVCTFNASVTATEDGGNELVIGEQFDCVAVGEAAGAASVRSALRCWAHGVQSMALCSRKLDT